MPNRIRVILRISHTVLLVLMFASLAAAQRPGNLVIFGDSTSDSGNYFAITGESSHPPFDEVPAYPYTMGGHHFSNGATWIERLSTMWGVNPSAHPSARNPGRFTNYAMGSARARPDAPEFPMYHLGAQVEAYLDDFGGMASPDCIYVIWIGTNDVRDAFVQGGDPVIVNDALTAIVMNITLLAQQGARQFIVLNIPDLGLVPAVNKLPDPIPLMATGFTMAVNEALDDALDMIEPDIVADGGELRRVDMFQVLHTIVADPEAAGFDNVTDPCLIFGVDSGFMPPNPNGFLFWDGIHPTKGGHRYIAEAVAAMLE